MSKFWERFFYLVAYIGQGSSYVSPRVYAIMHRMHHAYTDTEKDPHSPLYDESLWKMMWRSRVFTSGVYNGTIIVEERFLKNLPDWPALDRIAHSWISRVAWIGVYIAFYFLYAPSAWWFLLIPIHILMLPLHGAVINWFAHKYGSVNFKLNNTSKNLYPMDIFLMGEAYHNNHHKTPGAINFGKRWYEFDPTYPIISFLNWVHVVRVNKVNRHSNVELEEMSPALLVQASDYPQYHETQQGGKEAPYRDNITVVKNDSEQVRRQENKP